ncbi:F0F1 ATP synthase subunit delta [Arsenophonus symbiont of Ornithomya chloropus]|uniref:F0F1 ATP synthase subunit delta n=1 Tax=Arsenophonus symbiont of Ornithomya chloropus TaxID=634121 RepID=UPI0032B12E6A
MITIARPYAKAIFDLAEKDESLDEYQNMLTFIVDIINTKEINQLISSVIAPKKIATILISICGDNRLNKYIKNLIYITAHNNRLKVLPEVLKQFISLRNSLEKKININITSAYKLNEKQKLKILETIKNKLLCSVNLNYISDKSLIGGIIINIGDLVIDGSIRNRIKQLNNTLKFLGEL